MKQTNILRLFRQKSINSGGYPGPSSRAPATRSTIVPHLVSQMPRLLLDRGIAFGLFDYASTAGDSPLVERRARELWAPCLRTYFEQFVRDLVVGLDRRVKWFDREIEKIPAMTKPVSVIFALSAARSQNSNSHDCLR